MEDGHRYGLGEFFQISCPNKRSNQNFSQYFFYKRKGDIHYVKYKLIIFTEEKSQELNLEHIPTNVKSLPII